MVGGGAVGFGQVRMKVRVVVRSIQDTANQLSSVVYNGESDIRSPTSGIIWL
jgi:hypothetical protein